MKETPPDGVIRFEVDKISTLRKYNSRYSPMVEVKGVPWRIAVAKEDGLHVALYCMNNQSSPSNIHVDLELSLSNSDTSENITKKRSKTFYNNYNRFAHHGSTLLEWDKLLDDEEGFIKEDKIVVEVRFWISMMDGIISAPRIDFSDPSDPCHDVALIIDGEKVYVNKGILAVYSSFFKTMFYGEFAEKDKKEIEMKDIDREEFVELLHVIYPVSSIITENSAEFLLKLSDRFHIESVIKRVEEFLMEYEFISNIEKLRIADKYRLGRLQDDCLCDLDTKQDFQDIKDSPVYSGLSSDTKVALFERMLEI